MAFREEELTMILKSSWKDSYLRNLRLIRAGSRLKLMHLTSGCWSHKYCLRMCLIN
jgi:hypothetical protein